MRNKSGRDIIKLLLPALFVFWSSLSFGVTVSGPDGEKATFPALQVFFWDDYSDLPLWQAVEHIPVGLYRNFVVPGCVYVTLSADWLRTNGGQRYLRGVQGGIVIHDLFRAVDHQSQVYVQGLVYCRTAGDVNRYVEKVTPGLSQFPAGWSCAVGSLGSSDTFWQSSSSAVWGADMLTCRGSYYYDRFVLGWLEVFSRSSSLSRTSAFDFAEFGGNTCLIQCKAELSARKFAIEAEGNELFANFTRYGYVDAPCIEPFFCWAGREQSMQPFVNGVLLAGSFMSAAVIFRKKKPKGRDRNK